MTLGRPSLVVLSLLAAVLAAACEENGGGGAFVEATVFNVQARGNAYEPSALSIPAGTEVRLQMVNHDDVDHDLVIDRIDIDILQSDLPAGTDPGPGLTVFTQVDETQSIVFTARTPGEYAFYCSIDDHREAGMTGVLTVAPPAGD